MFVVVDPGGADGRKVEIDWPGGSEANRLGFGASSSILFPPRVAALAGPKGISKKCIYIT